MLGGDEYGDVDGASLGISLGDGAGGESTASLMSQRPLNRISAKAAFPIVPVPHWVE